MIDYACFCYMLENRLDLIDETMWRDQNNLNASLECAMAKCILKLPSSGESMLNVIDCFINASQFKDFSTKLLFSLIVNSEASMMSKQELTLAVNSLIKLTDNSALSFDYLRHFASNKKGTFLNSICLNRLDELGQDIEKQIKLKYTNDPVFNFCLFQFRSYQYTNILEFFKQACLNKNGHQLFIIELLINNLTANDATLIHSKSEFVIKMGEAIIYLSNNKPYEANCMLKNALCISDNSEMEYLLDIISINWIRDLLVF